MFNYFICTLLSRKLTMMEPYSESLQESSPPKTFFKNILSYFSKLFCNYVY